MVACALGLEVITVTLGTSGGLTRLGSEPSHEDGLLFQLAGPVAEWLAAGPPGEGSLSDRVNAFREAFDITGDLSEADALVAKSEDQVRDLLLLRWPSVKLVARALVDRSGRLTGADLERLIRPGLAATELVVRVSAVPARFTASLVPGA